ncbi:NAD(P)-dependent oxidoreductase [Mycobacterium deserti]|uniref:NAD(P)-dependent oxidoreductase n=1 Tax=Mycobacterium deserti TaxID=2978347 RepID=A0ABT2MGF6_9MYCO|nr:NAD(P)-dependent oxidoreductase [Mycobacterium deserti]MCT7660609.1 NAD(P)-dependent oxidoreductase [Mycobacterium deserti]
MTRVGFVGAGRMGGPMIGRLVESGHEVQALGRSDQKSRVVEELGARPVADVTEVPDGADVVIVCVFTDEQVRTVCLDDGLVAAMRAGSTLVLHTTGSPRTAQTVAAQNPAIAVVDAPVSGGPHNIAAGEVTLFVGGSDDAVAHARPILGAYGDPILHVGPLGAGQAVKLVNNAVFAAQIGLLGEAVALGRRLGVDEPKLLSAISNGSGASRVGGFVAAAGSVATFAEATQEFVSKDVDVVRKTAADLGSDLGLLDAVIDAGIRP